MHVLVSQPKTKGPPYGGLFVFGLGHRRRTTFDKFAWSKFGQRTALAL